VSHNPHKKYFDGNFQQKFASTKVRRGVSFALQLSRSANSEIRIKAEGTAMKTESKKQEGSPANHPQFLTVDEVAAMLRIKVRTVYEMVSQKRIPFRKAGRRTVFLLEEIMEWTSQRQ
jgi:excisionase family DNA binding protein